MEQAILAFKVLNLENFKEEGGGEGNEEETGEGWRKGRKKKRFRKPNMVVHTCNPSSLGGKARGSQVEPNPGSLATQDLISKHKKRTRSVVQWKGPESNPGNLVT